VCLLLTRPPLCPVLQLFSLTLTNEPAFVSRIAHHALMQIGAAEPVQFVITLAENPMRSARHFDPREYSHALSVIGNLVKKKPVYLLPGMHENENEAPLLASHRTHPTVRTQQNFLDWSKPWYIRSIRTFPRCATVASRLQPLSCTRSSASSQ